MLIIKSCKDLHKKLEIQKNFQGNVAKSRSPTVRDAPHNFTTFKYFYMRSCAIIIAKLSVL